MTAAVRRFAPQPREGRLPPVTQVVLATDDRGWWFHVHLHHLRIPTIGPVPEVQGRALLEVLLPADAREEEFS